MFLGDSHNTRISTLLEQEIQSNSSLDHGRRSFCILIGIRSIIRAERNQLMAFKKVYR